MSLTIPVKELFSKREGITSKHDSWEEIELKDAITVQNGYPFESKLFNVDSNGEPLIRIRDILNHKSETYYNGNYDQNFVVRNGDLLVGMDGDFNCALWKGENGLLNQRVCRLIPNENVLIKKFLYYGIGGYLNKINENTSSVTVKHLSSNSIKEIPFPLPPLPEQKRIVAKLDKLFAHLDQLKARLENVPTLLKQFRQAVLTQAVTNSRSPYSSKTWVDCTLSEVTDLDVGNAFKSKEFESSGVRLLRGENIEPGSLRWTKTVHFPKEKLKRFEHLYINDGDVILAMDRPLVSSGLKIAIAKRSDLPCVLVQRVARFKPSDNLSKKFLYLILSADSYINHLFGEQKGTQIPHISAKQILAYRIKLPPVKDQIEIVNKVESLFAMADKIEASYNTLKEKIDQLPQAILSKAFRGELVERDVNDKFVKLSMEGVN